jgi:DNA-binding NarL/FixJ family response regulator
VRDGLAAILGLQPDITVVGEAGTGREACALFDRHRPDVLLLDLKMPDMGGLEWCKPCAPPIRKLVSSS